MKKKYTDEQNRARAYALADEIETRADAIQRQSPKLSYVTCLRMALEKIASAI